MLLPITILIRESASEPPQEKAVLIKPDAIARVEDSDVDGMICVWMDGTDRPYWIQATIADFWAYMTEYADDGDDECEPVG